MSFPLPSCRPTLLAGALILVLLGIPGGSAAQPSFEPAELPPLPPWDGASRALMRAADDPWVTPSEATGLTASPSYDETVAWLGKLVAAAPELTLVSLGLSPEGREIWMVVADASGARTARELAATGKPVLLAHGGIHSGEIDGKDAGLMFLRDLVLGDKKALLEPVSFLFIPILNVDGHERSSAYGRINQRGPTEMGWRTNARNLNLNRDFAKLDSPELRALVRMIEEWSPDLYLDLHVTDGADYQYDITFGFNGSHAWSPASATWMEEVLTPALMLDLEEQGHIPGPLVFLADKRDPTRGNYGWTAGPRFSNGYGDARHLPTVLVENHSLKPYDQRVLGTYVLLESSLVTLGERGEALRQAVELDRARRPAELPLGWRVPAEADFPQVDFLGIASRLELSPISGGLRQVWTGEPATFRIPVLTVNEPTAIATRPQAYWIPAAWPEVIERLELHGIQVERPAGDALPAEIEAEVYRLEEAELAPDPFEGHVRVSARAVAERRRWTPPPGAVRVPTDQPLGNLAMLLLEPAAPDSFFQWGFYLEVLQRTEYFEAYVAEPLAERMLAEDPALAQEFRRRLASDPEFAADSRARLDFFYRRTPYSDARWNVYPVVREVAGDSP